MKIRNIFGLTAVLLVSIGLAGCKTQAANGVANDQPDQSSAPVTKITATPTLFFHGWGSSYHAETQMASAAVKAGAVNQVIRANVARDGKVTLIGKLTKKAKNPIVQVNYIDNKNGDYHNAGDWAKNVIVKLQKQYQIKKFNVVGHSMGNMAIAYYLLDHGQNKQLPQMQKEVDIAGHFNGILAVNDKPNQMKLAANGRPTKMDSDYRELLALRKTYPKNQVKVLNIYGDKNDGTHSDGAVSNASSQSLKYLVADRAQSYQEQRIVGAQAQHSKLHENQQVDRLLINFLWK